MPSIRQSIRSSTASKRPTSAIADGQIALNTASGTPGIFFKDNANNIIKAGPAHYGASAPNSSPAVGGSTGNSIGEAWLDSSLTPAGWKIWNGSAWVNATPLSSDTVQGLVELATNAETQAGVDAARAVTAASLQSKVSDSISTTSASGIASSTAVKTAYDLANAALPKSGGIVTGNLEIGSTGSFTFEGSTADGFETTLAVVDPTADRTITFPNTTGTVVTTGDSGTVTSTMILDGTILNADINASAAIVDTKLATIATALKVSNSATTAASANTASAIVARDASGNFTAGTITAALTGAASSNVLKAGDTMTGVLAVTAGTAALPGIAVSGDPNTGIYSPGADQLAISTSGTGRLFVNAGGNLGVGLTPSAWGSSWQVIQGIGGSLGSNSSAGLFSINNAYSDGTNWRYANNGTASTYLQLSGEHIWQRAVTGTAGNVVTFLENARIDSSGRLGLGTSAPGSLLDLRSASAPSLHISETGFTPDYRGYSIDLSRAQQTGGINFTTSSPSAFLDLYAGGSASALGGWSGQIRFFTGGTNSYGTERACIDSSGRLLVGTSSERTNVYYTTVATTPKVQFETSGSSYSNGLSLIHYSASGFSPVLTLGLSASNTPGTNTAIANLHEMGTINFVGNDGTNFRTGATIVATNDQASDWAVGDCPTRLVFSVTADGASSPTERMRINSSGAFKASNTGSYSSASGPYHEFYQSTNTAGLYIRGTNASQTATILEVNGDRTTTNATYSLIDAYNGNFSGRFSVRDSGNAVNTNNSYGAISDLKLKENIVDANSQWSDIKALQVRNYNFKEGQTHTQIGLVAQETELVSPGLVNESPDRDEEGNDLGTVTKSVNYSVLYMKAVKALQEAMERIETLEASNADMLARVTALEAA
jgi:hypothetical protein